MTQAQSVWRQAKSNNKKKSTFFFMLLFNCKTYRHILLAYWEKLFKNIPGLVIFLNKL